jgi:predicted dehydrogenase
MTKVIRWGILGASNFAATLMGPAIHAAHDAELAALGTSSPDKADRFRAFCPSVRVENYEALLADPDIDAIYIPLPNHLHVEWTRKALQAGKPVLTEKPIAMRAEEIDELIALRDKTGIFCTEAYMIVHHPQWQKVRELVRGGALGTLRHVDTAFSYNNRDAANIRNRPETGGGGVRDIGVYTYGSVRWATGEEPVDLSADITWENGVDVIAHVAARFPSFSYRAMTATRLAARQEVVFQGDEAWLRVTAPFNAGLYGEAQIEIRHPDGRYEYIRFPAADHYKLQVEAFGRTLTEGAAYPWNLEDARGTQAMIDRVFTSARG